MSSSSRRLILFGLASLRARVFPRALSVAVAVAGLIGFQAAMPGVLH